MLIWMVYVMVVTLLLSAAAFCAERASRVGGGTSRWIWLISIVASLLVPVAISSVSIQVPSIVSPTVVEKVIPLNSVTSSTLSPLRWMAGRAGNLHTWRDLDPLLKQSWLLMSVLLTVALAASGLHLLVRKRQWATSRLHGADIYLSRDVGPAVVGLLRPRIVVPEWIMQATPARQSMVIAHEQSHLDAGDQRLLTVALCLLVFMPWNLPLWWQLRRLRHAIEVDCDARVLRRGHSPAAYGETLIEVGQRQSSFIGAVAAMSESVSFLEQRIQIMTRMPTRWWRISAAAFGALSLGMVAAAAQVSPPNAGGQQQITLSAEVLDRYVGTYQFGETAVLTVTRSGQQLSAQLTGQGPAEIYPESETTFFYKVVKATIDFESDGAAAATALVLHQNGADQRAVRVDAATAEQVNATLAARVQSQTPTPGSEAALRRLIDSVMSGKPIYDEMSPALANATREQLPRLQPGISAMGAVKSVEFRGVGNQGWDVYDVRHEKGSTTWRIALAQDGKIAGALVQAGP